MEDDKEMVEIDKELIKELYTFVAQANNYLMTISVDGDNILRSADLMKDANKICNTLKEIGDLE